MLNYVVLSVAVCHGAASLYLATRFVDRGFQTGAQKPQAAAGSTPAGCSGTSRDRTAAGSYDQLAAAAAVLAHTAAGGWPALLPKVLSNLVTLRLKGLDGVQQLVALLTALNQTSSDNSRHQPQAVLCSLQVLEVQEAGDLAVCLPVLLSHCGWPVAEQLQQLCISGGVVAAICGNQQLPQLPALQELQLSDCELQHLPAWVGGNCSGLTKLVLRNNSVQQLPAAVSGLRALKVLDFSGCGQLRSLWAGVCQLTALEELHLAGASGLWLDYSSIAEQFGAPESLTATPTGLPVLLGSVGASAARATSGEATNEQQQQQQLQVFKDEQTLWKMSSGGSLLDQRGKGSAAAARAALPLLLPALPHQQQQFLLQELSPLQLTHLDLSCNRQLMVLPACLAQLKQLRVLDVRGCGLRWLGEDVLECSSLRELLLADNVLADVPEQISRLQQLQRLVLPSRGIGQYVVEQLELRSQPDVQAPRLIGRSVYYKFLNGPPWCHDVFVVQLQQSTPPLAKASVQCWRDRHGADTFESPARLQDEQGGGGFAHNGQLGGPQQPAVGPLLLVATKLTGDQNVPVGHVTFAVEVSSGCGVGPAGPLVLPAGYDSDVALAGAGVRRLVVKERYRGRSQIAFTSFDSPRVIAAELITFEDLDCFGLLWKHPVMSFSLFSRASPLPGVPG
eukprot:gene5319-5555_t